MSAHDKASPTAAARPGPPDDGDSPDTPRQVAVASPIRLTGAGNAPGAAARNRTSPAGGGWNDDDEFDPDSPDSLPQRRARQMRRAGQPAAAAMDPTEDEAQRANRKRNRAIRAAQRPTRAPAAVGRTAGRARLKRRHLGIALSFLLLVVAPVAATAWYLYERAADQYSASLGFSVRGESGPTSADLLGGIGSMLGATSSSGSDTDILYKFIQSRDLVEAVNARMDLQAIWSKPENDPIFAYRGGASSEDLLAEWERKVRVYYDNGMVDLRVLAFDPVDARDLAQAIYDESTLLINQLNDIAREDGLRYARDELDRAQERLRTARAAVTEFRNRHQLVDPRADVQRQVGVVASLEEQLARELVEIGMLQSNAQPSDSRISQSQLRIDVIRGQIQAEREKFGSETATGEALSEVVGQYETLAVDREFAERAYTATLASYDTARAEAVRQSRYLAAYVKPSIADEPEYPQRTKLLLMMAGFLLTLWMVMVLIFYSLRDRR